MRQRVLVTGASGFIGRALCASLVHRGFEVHGTSRRPPSAGAVWWHAIDLLDQDARALLTAVRPDALVHLAWVAPPAPYRDDPRNPRWASATRRLALQARDLGVSRQVFAGSSMELAPPTTAYNAAKQALYQTLIEDLRDTSWSWARPFLVYGPGEASTRLIPSVARALVEGRPVALGRGLAIRDFIHVEDVAEALVRLVETDRPGPIDLGTGRAMAVADVARLLGHLAGRPDLVHIGAGPDRAEAPRLVADPRSLRQLGAAARISLEVGLEEALNLRHYAMEAA